MSKVLREERARLAASLGSFVVRRTDPTFHPMGSNEPYNDAGDRPLTLYTLYGPPEHRDGVVHRTKAEADASEEHFDGKTTE